MTQLQNVNIVPCAFQLILAPPIASMIRLYTYILMLLPYTCREPKFIKCKADIYCLHASNPLIHSNLEESLPGVFILSIISICDIIFLCVTTCCTLCTVSDIYQYFVYILNFVMFMYFNDLHCSHVYCSHSYCSLLHHGTKSRADNAKCL